MTRFSRWLSDGSGPKTAWLFQRALSGIHAVAFASLAVQVQPLIGSRGLLPWAELAQLLAERHISWLDVPSVLRLAPTDGALVGLAWAGVALALLALFGMAPRVLLAVNGALYLSFVTAGQDFFTFQWDALLIESTLLALLLPTDRPAPAAHALFRLLLFKLYFESGVAKWMSAAHDWQSGDAMTAYYQTAPIPTRLAWYAHHLPVGWHHLEARGTLVLELLVPALIFGPRLARRIALAAFSLFQLADILTANYGFFCWLALALGIFLLDDDDLPFARPSRPPWRWELSAKAPFAAVYVFFSGLGFWGLVDPRGVPAWTRPLRRLEAPFWAINTFHLFGSITTERIEPSFETREGGTWIPRALRWKAGPADRAPPFVAPHQPRLDFQLWFYGLRARGQPPEYVDMMLQRLCYQPAAVQAFFAEPLPAQPTAVRVSFAKYTFTSSEERARTGNWWNVEPLGVGPELDCADDP